MKKLSIFLLLIFFSLSFSASAESSLKITEIMYDLPGTDTGREWVEVFNEGSEDIDLSLFKFFEANTNHGITPVGASILPAGAFAVIADNPDKFSADWPAFSGLVFDSSFSLSNTGEDLALKDKDGNIVDQVSYAADQGAAGDEKSLAREGENFIAAIPTPGQSKGSNPPPPDEEDQTEEDPDDNDPPVDETAGGDTEDDEPTSSSSAKDKAPISKPAPKAPAPKVPKFSLKIDLPDNAIANSDFLISPVITGANETASVKYLWNFGNGEVIETRHSKPFGYIYQFPGTYVISLNYFKDDYSQPAKATAKIKVEENPLTISAVLPDGSIAIKNGATHQIDLSGWILKSGMASFTFPSETSVMAGSSVIFPAKVTKFAPGIFDAELLYPSGILAYSLNKYANISAPKAAAEFQLSSTAESVSSEEKITEDLISPEASVSGADLSASVSNGVEDGDNPLLPWALGLAGIIFVSCVASYFIFSGKAAKSTDFKILD